MSTLHTPGPWLVEINPTISEGQQIASYSEDGNRALQVIVRSFNTAKDTALIAASPDLLAVTQGFRRKLATYVSVYPGDKQLRRLLDQCDAAIAKATA